MGSGTRVQSASALGRAIRDARRARGLTQSRLADLSGVTQPTVSSAERGVRRISLDTVLRLFAALQLDLFVEPRAARSLPASWKGRA